MENALKKKVPVVEGFFTWPADQPSLIGGRCKTCGRYFFPKHYPVHRPDCLKEDLEEVTLSSQGKLASFTWEYYKPPPPFRSADPFIPFGVGLVELPEGIRVMGMLTNCQFEDLEIDAPVELVIDKLYADDQGNEFLTWKFKLLTTRRGKEAGR
ncbi:MAG: DNA-binding protein [Desulfobacteraceae bacterium]|nr:MAG: DNA-binding protein [Desulfobacteraceae bacterium]